VETRDPGGVQSRGISFRSLGPAAGKLRSPNLLLVRLANNVPVSFEIDLTRRRPTSESRRQSSARYCGATPSRQRLVKQHPDLEDDSLMDWKPVQLRQWWSGVITSRRWVPVYQIDTCGSSKWMNNDAASVTVIYH